MTNGITRCAALGAMVAPTIIGLTCSARADTRTLKIAAPAAVSNSKPIRLTEAGARSKG